MKFIIVFFSLSFAFCFTSFYMKAWSLFASIAAGFSVSVIVTMVIGFPLLAFFMFISFIDKIKKAKK